MADGSHWSNQWLKMFIIFANEKWDTSLFRCARGAWMFCINLWWNEAGIIWTQDWFLRYNQKFLCPITPFSSLLQHLMVYKFPHFYLLEQASALCKSIISLSNLHSLMWWSLGTRRNFLSSAKRVLLKNSIFDTRFYETNLTCILTGNRLLQNKVDKKQLYRSYLNWSGKARFKTCSHLSLPPHQLTLAIQIYSLVWN